MISSRRALYTGWRQLGLHSRSLARDDAVLQTCWRANATRAFATSASTAEAPSAPASDVSSPASTTGAPAAASKPAASSPAPTTGAPSAASNPTANRRPFAPVNRQPPRPAARAPPVNKPAIPTVSPHERPTVLPTAVMQKNLNYDSATETNGDLPGIDWTRSFYGISSLPVTSEQSIVLLRPLSVKEIEIKPDGIIYLPEIRYRRRLNEAFGPMGWGLVPRGEAVVGETIVTREYALIVGGRFVSQSQGESTYFGTEQLPSSIEACKSNALMRCCKDLGIAAELWDPTFIRWYKQNCVEEVWVEHITTKKRRQFSYRIGAVKVIYPYRLAKPA